MTDYDTEPPPTDPFGTAASILSTETSEQRTAHIFGSIVRQEMSEQLAPVRATLGTIADEQQSQGQELRSLARRVSALERQRQTVPLLIAVAALVVGIVALGTVSLRPYVVLQSATVER